MATTKKRVLSLLMALVMALSLLPTIAFATEDAKAEQAAKQIINAGGTVFYDKNGIQHSSGTLGERDIVVEMSKTLEATGEENLFDVTLQVKTNQKLTEIPASTPDAAVMLVLDVSNSMNDCVNCGKGKDNADHKGKTETKYYCSGKSGPTYEEHWHYSFMSGRFDCKNCHKTQRQHNAVTITTSKCAYRSRLADAQSAALDFLNQFANETGATGTDRRMVAVVSFGSNAKRELNWVNVRTQEGMTAAQGAINGVQVAHGNSDNGGTNVEGGLMLAKNILNAGRQNKDQIKDVNYLYTILLTDGNPTFHVSKSNQSTNSITGEKGGYTVTNEADVEDVGKEAGAIRSITKLSKLYSICFGHGVWNKEPFGDWRNANPQTNKNMTVGQWLAAFSNTAYDGQATGLFDSFDSIVDQIATAAQAWQVRDTMGTDIRFQSVLPVSNKEQNGTINNVIEWSQDGKSFVWNVLASQYDDNITDIKTDDSGKMVSGTLGYTFKYQIRLNNTGFTRNDERDTNASAILKYMVAEQDGSWPTSPEALKEGVFAVPRVKGYVADLSFNKVNDRGENLSGAQFDLVPSPAGSVNWSGSGTSGADGKIEFSKIPSGYSYVLKETAAPDKYNPVAPINVTVKYGEISHASTVQSGANIENGKLVDPAKQTYRDVEITKTWQKPADESTPDSITVTLKQDGVAMPEYTDFVIEKSACTVGTDGVWHYTFQNLPDSKPEGGVHVYTVEEAEMDGWTRTSEDGSLAIVNTASGKTSVLVMKDWLLPEGMSANQLTVSVTLTRNGTAMTGAEYTKTITGNGTVTFDNLDKYDSQNGQLYKYSVVEAQGSYQQAKPMEGGDNFFVFHNTVADEKTTISGTKSWNDGDDTASRPDSISVTLYQDGVATDKTATATAETEWKYSFSNLDRYEFTRDGSGNITAVREIQYSVKETSEIDGYVSTVAGNDIANTRTGTVNLTVDKVWVSESGHDDEVTVQLYANGVVSGEPVTFADSHTFEGLDKYDAQGKVITYSVTELNVPTGYTPSYGSVTTTGDGDYQVTITNKQNDADEKATVTVSKVWRQPGTVAAQTATFTLYADGAATDKTVDITGNGTASFENLPRYKTETLENGDTLLTEIVYTVEESVPSGYTSSMESVAPDSSGHSYFHFTNTITGTTSVAVEKTWKQPSGVNTPAITIQVQRSLNGLEWENAGEIVLESGSTSGKLDGLAKYSENGQLYFYRVEELSVNGYSSEVNGGVLADGTYAYNIINTINQSDADITVSKIWIDGSTPDSERPAVTLDLLQDGVTVATAAFAYENGKVMVTVTKGTETSDPVEATVNENTWSVRIPGMPLYNESRTARYTYTVAEYSVPAGYKATAAGTTVTNQRVGTIDIPITKYWVDPTGTQHPEITLRLKGTDGSEKVITVTQSGDTVSAVIGGETVPVTVEGNTWTFTVKGLSEYNSSGSKIQYSLSEDAVPGYTTSTVDGQKFAVKNTIEQDETYSIGAVKQWANMDVEGVYKPSYPETITVALFRNGNMVEGSKQTVNVAEDGTCTIQPYTDLAKYDLTSGQAYTYEIFELDSTDGRILNEGTISFGEDNNYTVTYGKQDGNVIITNTFQVPAKYLWIVKTHYVHYDYNGNQIAKFDLQSEINKETESKDITVSSEDYKVCSQDNLTYVYDVDNAGNKTEVTLTAQNHLYVLELYYTLKDEAPYVPPYNPGGDPTTPPTTPPTEIEDPDVPLGELPEEPTEPAEPEEPVEIEDPDVPLGEAPATGDSGMALWLTLMATSALGIAVLTLTNKKKGKHESQ